MAHPALQMAVLSDNSKKALDVSYYDLLVFCHELKDRSGFRCREPDPLPGKLAAGFNRKPRLAAFV